MIEVTGLSKRFGDTQALKGVSFTVEKGQIVGFLGANGAGKTTTMDIICGCIGADGGSARICGHDITEEPLAAKAKLGYLPDEPPLHLEMKVADFVAYAGKLHGLSGDRLKERVSKVIARLALDDVKDRIVGNLSKGYRQRVALAQAIVHDPEVLVLDEPTEGLDPNQIAQIRQLIRSLAGEHTIILSSHILSEVQNTCDHIVIIHEGQVVRKGSYEEIVAHMESGKVYRLKVAKGGRELQGAIAGIVTDVAAADSEDENELEFTAAAEADLDKIVNTVVQGGYGLRELTRKTRSLEDVFFQLTQ